MNQNAVFFTNNLKQETKQH